MESVTLHLRKTAFDRRSLRVEFYLKFDAPNHSLFQCLMLFMTFGPFGKAVNTVDVTSSASIFFILVVPQIFDYALASVKSC